MKIKYIISLTVLITTLALQGNCNQLYPNAEDNEEELALTTLMVLGSEKTAAQVRFYNATGATQSYLLSNNTGCIDDGGLNINYGSVAPGAYTEYKQVVYLTYSFGIDSNCYPNYYPNEYYFELGNRLVSGLYTCISNGDTSSGIFNSGVTCSR